MSALKDILKASVWGALLLSLIITASAAVFVAFDKTGNFYTTNKITDYKKTNAVINEALRDLEQYISENESKVDWYADSDEAVTAMNQFIEKGINDNCHTNCNELYYSSPVRSYEVRDFRNKLERLLDNQKTNDANKIVAFTLVMSLLTTLFAIYLLIALFSYKKLTANGLTILVLLISPFLLASASLAVARVGDYMEFKIESAGVYTITTCVAYIFIIFPPVILISRKRGYSISKIIKLDGYV